jgi:superfamily II DNA/RNA helicase
MKIRKNNKKWQGKLIKFKSVILPMGHSFLMSIQDEIISHIIKGADVAGVSETYQDYIHFIGRTVCWGKKGIALTFIK